MKKYRIIYADPPWQYDDKALNRGGAERYYNTMSLDEICSLRISDISHDDSILFLWATWPKLYESGKVIDSWGFNYKTVAFVWVKTNRSVNVAQTSFIPVDSFSSFWGMGRWTRSNTEFCLLATKGSPQRKSASVHQIIYSPVLNHSKKPGVVYDKIVKLAGDLDRIELFARNRRMGWDVFGNEVDDSVILPNQPLVPTPKAGRHS